MNRSKNSTRLLAGHGRLVVRGLAVAVVIAGVFPVEGVADLPSPPEPFEIQLRVTRRRPPPPPEPFAIQLVVRPEEPSPVPQPFAIDLTVVRSEPIPPPDPFAIGLSVILEIPPPPAAFPVRVTVARPDLPSAPEPFPMRVTVARDELPTAPTAFPMEVRVSRRGPPIAPAAFPLEVRVSRRRPPAAPASFPVQVSVFRPLPPPPPVPFPMRVNVVRLGADPKVEDLLVELRRLETASAEEATAVSRTKASLKRSLERSDHLLATCMTDLQVALEFLATGQQRVGALGEIRESARSHEAAAAKGGGHVADTSREVCALESVSMSGAFATELVADLERRVDDAETRAGQVSVSAESCRQDATEIRSEIREWQARWLTQIDESAAAVERQVDEAAAALVEAVTAAEELGASAIRLGELEAEAEPLIEEIEELVAGWRSPSLAEIRQEVLTEERRLSHLIGERVAEVLESHDHLTGEIESQQNQLDLVTFDVEFLSQETSRVRQELSPELTRVLSDTDRAAQSATESATAAGEAVAAARGCLGRIRAQVEAAEATLKTVPGLVGRSEGVAIAWLEELGLRPFLRGLESTLDEEKVGHVARQAPPPETRLRAGETVSLWIHASAVKPPPKTRVPVLTQAACTSDWPGTILVTESGGGNPRCECPVGQAWSKVSNRCLALVSGGDGRGGARGGDRDCGSRPGTVYDSRTDQCECTVGAWVAAEGRCVDTMVAERQKEIDNQRQGLDCVQLLSRIRTFRNHPGSIQRQMASSAETKARGLGCDDSAIKEAIEEGEGRVWSTPPTGGGSDAVAVGPEVPENREDLQPLTRASTQQPGGSENSPHSPGDCSRCDVYLEWLEENRGPCGYHPLRLPSICELDPECVYWAKECGRKNQEHFQCMAECSG